MSYLTSLRKAEQALVHDIETWLTVEGTASRGALSGALEKAYLRARHMVLYGALRHRVITVKSSWKMCLALVLERGDTFVDVGANVGRVSEPAARIVGATGAVYCFEPSPSVAACLRRRMGLLGLSNVTIYERAVGDSAGTSILHEFAGGHGGASSLRSGSYAGSTHNKETRVERRTLDGALQIEQLKLLKIDVEGSEIDVLAGAAALVERHQPVLFVEASRETQAAFGHTLSQLMDTLSALGYELYSWRTTKLVRVVRPEDIPAEWHHDDLFGFRPGRHDRTRTRFPA